MYGLTNSGVGAGCGLPVDASIIHVSAPYGSTVTFAKGGVITRTLTSAKSHLNSDDEMADYYAVVFPQNYGSWTINATQGTNSSSKTIAVNAAKQYDVILRYNQYLFNNGNQYVDVTGGWVPYTGASIYNGESYVAGPSTSIQNTLHIEAPTSANWRIDFRGIDNPVDVTKYSKLEADITEALGSYDRAHIIVCPSKTGELQVAASITLQDLNTPMTYSVDISALSGNYYVCAFARRRGDMYDAGYLTATRIELVI